MKKILLVVILIVIGLISFGCAVQNKVVSQTSTTVTSSTTVGSNPQTNHTSSNVLVGFKIQNAIVENNEDPVTKKVVDDHLEITLLNTIDKEISNLSVDYTITDLKNSKKESYSAKLEGFVLKAHETQIIHFDNKNETNHFWVNSYSMYYLSTDALEFNITVNAEAYKAQTISVKKDIGGAEIAD
jgi:hypothetical protein